MAACRSGVATVCCREKQKALASIPEEQKEGFFASLGMTGPG
jgi:hypothetical protein